MSDVLKAVCNFCGKEHDKVFKGYRDAKNKGQATAKRKIYLDETGREWRGKKCSTCMWGAVEESACLNCNKTFKININTGKIYCSVECKLQHYSENP